MTDRLPAIAADLAAELRRARCRTADHAKEPCKRCDALAAWDAYVAIVQVPLAALARHEAQAAVQNLNGERHD